MKHVIVQDRPTLGARDILGALLKLAGLVILLAALLAFPAFSQQLAVRMPLLIESDPVAIMGLETGRVRLDSASHRDAIRERRTQELAEARIAGVPRVELYDRMSTTIYFDAGSSTIRSDAIAALEAKLDLLRGIPTLRIRIEGQADVRGSNASNITLAWERAGAAKLWLTGRGIASDRIDAVGFSAWRPICEDRYESCWWQNRRAEFVIVARADGIAQERP